MRSRGQATPATVPYQSLGPSAQTISYSGPGATPHPAASLPSIGDYRNAPTGTMQPMATVPRRRRAGTRIALVAFAAVAAGSIAFGILAATRDQAAPAAAVPPDAAVTAIVNDAARPDAALLATAPVDAPPADPPKKDASVVRSSEKRTGRLVVRAFPVLTVYVDNRKIHDTPVDMKLPAGKHKLRLVNAEVGTDETLSVTIEENKATTIERN
jgi:hypothetical protein